MPNVLTTSLKEDENKFSNKKSVRFEEKKNKNDINQFDDSNKTDFSEVDEDDNGNIIIKNRKKNNQLNKKQLSDKMILKKKSQNSNASTSMPQHPSLIRNFLKLFRQFRSDNNSQSLNGECINSSNIKNSTSTSSIESTSHSNTFCIW